MQQMPYIAVFPNITRHRHVPRAPEYPLFLAVLHVCGMLRSVHYLRSMWRVG